MGDKKYVFRQIDRSDAINFLLPRHYSGRIPQIMVAYGVIDTITNAIVAVCTFGIPASKELCCGIGGGGTDTTCMSLIGCAERIFTPTL